MRGRGWQPWRPRSSERDAQHDSLPGPQPCAHCEDPSGTESGTLALQAPAGALGTLISQSPHRYLPHLI